MIRRFLFNLHLVLGLSVGLYLVVLGITGTFLVWNREADTKLNPYLVSQHFGKDRAPLDDVIAAFKKEAPGHDVGRLRQKSADGVWGVTIDGSTAIARHIYVDPYTAQVVGVRTRTSTFNGWVSWLHFNLYAGELGELWNGYGAIASMFLLGSGLYLWWPRTLSLLRQAVTVKRGASLKRRMHDWHNVVGFWSVGILLLTCITGAVFVWKKPITQGVMALTGSKPNAKTKVPVRESRLSYTELFEIGDKAIQGQWVSSVDLPRKPTEPFILRKDIPSSERWRGSLSVFIDPYSGRILKTFDTRNGSLGARIMEMNFPLHSGMWGGLITKILYSIAGLAPLILFVTGLWKWNSKRVGRAHNRARRATSSTASVQEMELVGKEAWEIS
jgi:uncharacterized iron-regulated membrane protein